MPMWAYYSSTAIKPASESATTVEDAPALSPSDQGRMQSPAYFLKTLSTLSSLRTPEALVATPSPPAGVDARATQVGEAAVNLLAAANRVLALSSEIHLCLL